MEKPKKTMLRIPEQVQAEIAEAARRNRRSVNSEILVRLERDLAREALDLGEDRGAAA
jgi:predicted HicB family RNase H-like nuclease